MNTDEENSENMSKRIQVPQTLFSKVTQGVGFRSWDGDDMDLVTMKEEKCNICNFVKMIVMADV